MGCSKSLPFPEVASRQCGNSNRLLDRAVTRCALENQSNKLDQDGRNVTRKIRLVSLGAGYDVRSIKLKERGVIDKAYELDLPEVVQAKRNILESRRFRRRRPHTAQDSLPLTYPVDLNDIERVKAILLDILQSSNEEWHTILLFEAVMIYLQEGVPCSLLHLCSEVLRETRQSGSLCFADRLENVPGGEYESACRELNAAGWSVVEWLPKPGLARHMGRAAMLDSVDSTNSISTGSVG